MRRRSNAAHLSAHAVFLCMILGLQSGPGARLRAETAEARIAIDSTKVEGHVDRELYGILLEHIGRSVVGGLWAEMLLNGSFESVPRVPPPGWRDATPMWYAAEGRLVHEDGGRARDGSRYNTIHAGDPGWGDYTLRLRARKTGGYEGFVLFFRVASPLKDCYRWELGQDGGRRYLVQRIRAGRLTTLAEVDGGVDADRWYDLEVRVAGGRIVCSRDGEVVHDVTDPDPIPTGGIGFGAFATCVQYAKAAVTASDGTLLWKDAFDAPVPNPMADAWRAVDSKSGVTYAWSSSDPHHGRRCQEVRADGTGTVGLAQDGLALRAGERYRASVWLRSDRPPGSVRARLAATKDGKTLAESPIDGIGATWQRHAIELTPAASCADGEFQIVFGGSGSLVVDQASLVPARTWRDHGCRTDLAEALASMQPGLVRWPGGGFAEMYRWKDGVGPADRRPVVTNHHWTGPDPNHFGTDEFMRFCRDLGAEPMIVINIADTIQYGDVSAFAREAAEWVEYCNGPTISRWGGERARNGHPAPYRVRHWELSNETWVMRAEAYGRRAAAFARAMRAVDPSIVLTAVGHRPEWNAVVIDLTGEQVEYIDHHWYCVGGYEPAVLGPVDLFADFAEITRRLRIQAPQRRGRAALLEWGRVNNEYLDGLHAALMLNALERGTEHVGMAAYAPILFHVKYALPGTQWGLVGFDAARCFLTPAGVAFRLWRAHHGDERLACAARGPACTVGGRPLDCVDAVASRRSADGAVFVKLVNRDPQREVRVALELDGRPVTRVESAERLSHDDLRAANSVDRPAEVRTAVAACNGPWLLPRHSALALRIR